MTSSYQIRAGENRDLKTLLSIENTCFEIDKLSRRSFLHFLKPGAHELKVVLTNHTIVGYVVILYRSGTHLARMYSIAVHPDYQGKGIARYLIDHAEQSARERSCAFMRLEVSVNNTVAYQLYKKCGYRDIGEIPAYYEDGSDAIRMEKRIFANKLKKGIMGPYYRQTTDFTCGPAALMMAMKSLNPEYEMSRQEELQIWREATAIFMTSGHGGCSPHGLSLSAWERGFKVDLYINDPGVPFLDGVRDPDKKAVIEIVHNDFLARIKKTDISIHVQDVSADDLQQIMSENKVLIALISTWRLNRNKAPHWVFIVHIDEHFIYINDPDTTEGEWQSDIDYIQVPIGIPEFIKMARFGQKKLRCLLTLTKRS